MVIEKKYQIALVKNAKGQITECLECKVVGANEYKESKKEAEEHKALVKKEEERIAKLEVEKEIALETKRKIANFFIAKSALDNQVDLGLVETNEKFEEAFNKFVYHGGRLDLEDAPTYFLKVLERLG